MKLLERYSTQCGLKIGNQFLLEKFYPLPNDNPYILIHASSGMPAKNYPYYNEVMDLLHPILSSNNISVYQIGGKDDAPIRHCIHLQGKTNLHQTNYLLKRCKLLIGNDSWSSHRCGFLNIPVLELFGPTEVENHAPYNYHPFSVFLKSHRFERKPSFASQESPMTIGLIPPEDVLNSIFKILGSSFKLNRKSLFIGTIYNLNIIEWIPDTLMHPDSFSGQPLICRYDLLNNTSEENEKFVAHALQSRRLNIVTNRELSLNLLATFKQNIEILNFEIANDTNVEYVKNLKRIGMRVRFFTKIKDSKELSDLRLKFFDITFFDCFAEKNKSHFISDSEKWSGKKLDPDTFMSQNNVWFRSNKFLLSQGKIYLSKYHLFKNLPTDKFENNVMPLVDDDAFWCDIDNFYVFQQDN